MNGTNNNNMNTPTRAADAPVPQGGTEQTAADQAASQAAQPQGEPSSSGESVVGEVISGAIDILISLLDD
ncbi:MAG: hypothetical protein JO000_06785 [Alphaproteobacteria bacterium]|nr:hypothetical protein [Alphaproteobacteria bacterium]